MSRGEVWEAATTEPAVGMWVLPALPRDLRGGVVSGERELMVMFLCLPSANAVDLKINPPDAWDADDAPEVCFAQECSGGGPLDDGKPDEAGEEQERDAEEEEELYGLSVLLYCGSEY